MRQALALSVLICLSCNNSPTTLTGRPVSPDAVRKACAVNLSCLTTPLIQSGASCVSQIENGLATGFGILFGPEIDDLQRYVDCAASASDCTTALNCGSRNHGPAYCAAHPGQSCDGNLIVNCTSGWGLEITDCGARGLHCGTGSSGAVTCTDGNSCNPVAPPRCDGNHQVTCTDGLESSVDCGVYFSGATCRAMTSGGSTDISCAPPASGACAVDGASCDGAASVLCESGVQLRVECGQFASHCVITNNKVDCVADATDCTDSSPDRCNGGALEMCVNGRYVPTACSSIGLTTCQATATGAKCS